MSTHVSMYMYMYCVYMPVRTYRAEQLKSLQGGEQYDILVIGGGVTGSGVALDAVTRGNHMIYTSRDCNILL